MSPEANLELMVLSRDEKQLQTTCADLLKKITSAPSYTQAEEAARALSAIKDPVVVPYLQQATTSWHLEPITIKALSEIGDTTATEALVSLLESKEHETSALSRVALARIEARTPDASLKERIRSVLESPNLQNQKQQ